MSRLSTKKDPRPGQARGGEEHRRSNRTAGTTRVNDESQARYVDDLIRRVKRCLRRGRGDLAVELTRRAAAIVASAA